MAIQDEGGLLALAKREGHEAGLEQGLREVLLRAIVTACEVLDIELTPEFRKMIELLELAKLTVLIERLKTERRWP